MTAKYTVTSTKSKQPRKYTAVIEKDAATGLYVGSVPGFPGAHTQAETKEELQSNLQEVLSLVLSDADSAPESEYIGTQLVVVQGG